MQDFCGIIGKMNNDVETLLSRKDANFLFDEHREDFINAKRQMGNICLEESKMFWQYALKHLLLKHFDRASILYESEILDQNCASELFIEFHELFTQRDNLTRQRVWGGV